MGPAEKLREQARPARYYAQVATRAEDRAAWRAIAEEWERMGTCKMRHSAPADPLSNPPVRSVILISPGHSAP
jgi:hypothetical protein